MMVKGRTYEDLLRGAQVHKDSFGDGTYICYTSFLFGDTLIQRIASSYDRWIPVLNTVSVTDCHYYVGRRRK